MTQANAIIKPTTSAFDQAAHSAHAAIDQAIDRAADAARPAVDHIAAGAHQAVDKLAGAAIHAAGSLDAKSNQLKDAQTKLTERCCEYVQAKPLTSLGIAVATGFLLSLLVRAR